MESKKLRIGFSHNYSKLHGQTSALLIDVQEVKKSNLDPDFIQYDTDGVFELIHEDYLKLLFIGNKGIPFTTLRENKQSTWNKYCPNINSVFEVYVKENPAVVAG